MPRKPDPKSNPISQGGLRFVPGQASAVPASAVLQAREHQPQYAWEMTLEQFQQTYFPELCGKPMAAAATDPAGRKAA